jgi:hypothetical protein
MIHVDAPALAARYIAVWTEPDAARRRTLLEDLWSPDARHILQPPQEIRDAATRLGFTHTTLEAHGHDAIATRVHRGYDEFVAPGQYTFRPTGDAVRLTDTILFTWEMLDLTTNTVAGGGREVVVLTPTGQIATDYMFPGV